MEKKKSTAGIIYLVLGTACLLAAIFTKSDFKGVLLGLSGAGILTGCMIIYKYRYFYLKKK